MQWTDNTLCKISVQLTIYAIATHVSVLLHDCGQQQGSQCGTFQIFYSVEYVRYRQTKRQIGPTKTCYPCNWGAPKLYDKTN